MHLSLIVGRLFGCTAGGGTAWTSSKSRAKVSPPPSSMSSFPRAAYVGSSGVAWSNSSPWNLFREVSQGKSGISLSRIFKSKRSRSTLKLISWPSLRQWGGPESCLCFRERAKSVQVEHPFKHSKRWRTPPSRSNYYLVLHLPSRRWRYARRSRHVNHSLQARRFQRTLQHTYRTNCCLGLDNGPNFASASTTCIRPHSDADHPSRSSGTSFTAPRSLLTTIGSHMFSLRVRLLRHHGWYS